VWSTPRALVAHVAMLVWIPGCAVACWWQVGIALSGDSLGWVYSVMWPCFAVFGTIFWWHFLHDDPQSVGRRGLRRLQARVSAGGDRGDVLHDDTDERRAGETASPRTDSEDPELAAYNDYLAALAREDRPNTWRRR
jgi:hypothetical protein